MTDQPSILAQAVAQIRNINDKPRRRAIDEERDYLETKRIALTGEIASVTTEIRDLTALVAEIAKALDTKTRVRAELVQAYSSTTATHAALDAEAMRLGAAD